MGWESKNFSFLVPFRDLTKSEMVKEVIERGMPIPKVQQIRSCYDSKSHKGCGKCRPCLNKAVALVNNNIFDPELFEERITSKSIQSLQKEVLERIKYGGKLPVKYVEEVKRARGLLR
jgi:NAD(P)H-nitrite reductase large subunit